MTMTSAVSLSPSTGSGSTRMDGPIVLAAKPFVMTEAPLAVARWLAHREDRELHVVSIVEPHDVLAIAAGAAPLPDRFCDDEREAVAQRISADLGLASADGLVYKISVEKGPDAQAVVDHARARDARLIVIGTGRHDALGRFIYGERAMQIVRAADRPVLVVPRGEVSPPLHHAMVAVDFSRASLRAARAILPMLTPGADLTLLHVRPAHPKSHTSPADASPLHAARDDLFARFISMLALPPGIHVSTRLLWGDPVDAIVAYAKSSGADLLACGRVQHHSLAERILVGSVSAGLLRHAHCAILVAPELRDDARADERAPLTGVAEWEEASWSQQLTAFSLRNRDRRVRLGIEVQAGREGRCVAQDYLLRSMAFNDREHLRLLLVDRQKPANRLAMSFGDIRDLALFSDIDGKDTRLVFEYDGGRGTLTMSSMELPDYHVDGKRAH
ncbi:MAG: universal stress protein [bacterium]